MEGITIKHSFNLGDAITLLPYFKDIYERTGKKTEFYQRLNLPAFYAHDYSHPTQHEGYAVSLNEKMWQMLTPLLESQEYISKCQIWKGEKVDYDFDETRQASYIPMPNSDIHWWNTFTFPKLTADLSNEWLSVPKETQYKDTIIVNRTERYLNPYITYFFLKPYQDNLIFAGTQQERDKFCKEWDLDIPLLYVPDFYQLAIIINSCKFFIGVQSFCWHLANAMGVNRILEVCTSFPNTLPTTKNGFAFLKQQGIEYYFNKLIN